MRFIGLDTYEAAGGYVRRDLFSDDGNAGYITDAELLQRLVAQKLDVATEEVRAEGWGWTETRVERDVLELNRYGRLRPIKRPFTDDEQREMDALTAEQDELARKLEALSEDDKNTYEGPTALMPKSNGSTPRSSQSKAAPWCGIHGRWPRQARS